MFMWRILLWYLLCSGLVSPIIATPPGQSASCNDWWRWAGQYGPGLGIEFETPMIHFLNAAYTTFQDTKTLLRHVVNGMGGAYWSLTAETEGRAGSLRAEVILDGKRLRVGYPQAEQAAMEASQRMVTWDPVGHESDIVQIQGSQRGNWRIHTDGPNLPSGQPRRTGDLIWFPQVTAPLPLRCIYDLVLKSRRTQPRSWLLPPDQDDVSSNLIVVYEDFFQATGIPANNINDDVLGFFSLIISYVKQVDKAPVGTSPKRIVTIMPRTDWTTIYNTIRRFITMPLWDLVNILVCYRTRSNGRTTIDKDWCGGTVQDPEPGEELDDQFFEWSEDDIDSDDDDDTPTRDLWVKGWIQSIQYGQIPDQLTLFDYNRYSGSIGGLRTRMEYVLYTAVLAPIWEFRDLVNHNTLAFAQIAGNMMTEVVQYHQDYKRDLHLRTPHTWDPPGRHRVRRELRG